MLIYQNMIWSQMQVNIMLNILPILLLNDVFFVNYKNNKDLVTKPGTVLYQLLFIFPACLWSCPWFENIQL
jgi:hypothetical protein